MLSGRDGSGNLSVCSVIIPYMSVFVHTDLVVDQCQAVKFGLDIARGMAFLHTLEPLIPRHYLNSRSVMVSSVGQPATKAIVQILSNLLLSAV